METITKITRIVGEPLAVRLPAIGVASACRLNDVALDDIIGLTG
jgi:hypothetical protein